MRLSMTGLLRGPMLATTLMALGSVACGPASGSEPRHPKSAAHLQVTPKTVSEREFAGAVHTLLVSGDPTQERLNLLAGVVRRQLAHAKTLFEGGHRSEGLDAVTGALLLVRTGELRSEMFVETPEALDESARLASERGNEGRALALYTMLYKALPKGSARDDVQEHLDSLSRWMKDTRGKTDLQAAEAGYRFTAHRSALEPGEKQLGSARDAALEWIRLAAAVDLESAPLRTPADREEAITAYRALSSGAAAIASLYLRHGDARGALRALDKGLAPRVVRPALRDVLEAAAKGRDPEAWAALFQLFRSAENPEHPETSLDGELARAAAWGCALQLYRLEPDAIRAALPLAVMLVENQLAEGAPLVLASALKKDPSSRGVSTALAMVLQAVVEQDRLGNISGARRIYAAAEGLLELAEKGNGAGQIRPSPTRLRFLMGAIETRAGQLKQARPHVLSAVKAAPSVEALGLLAAIERQRGSEADALRALASMAELAQKQNNTNAETRARILRFEIHRDAGRKKDATQELAAALNLALDARRLARNNAELAGSERLLARVLEHYGDKSAARRATKRAFAASGSDSAQLTATTLDAARRSLVLGDLKGGREALDLAIENQLDASDLVYVALWVQLLERRVKAPRSGEAGDALASLDASSGWTAQLRAWGTGKLDSPGLERSAKNEVEKTEAEFYATLGAEPTKPALDRLARVAGSEAIELVEVMIARDLIAQASGGSNFDLPAGVTLP